MADEVPGKPKVNADASPWYRLATLYGEPARKNYVLRDKNRVAWNRYMAGHLTDAARATLVKEERLPAEELMPFSPDERAALEQDFAKRSELLSPSPCPKVGEKIDF